MTNRRDRRAGAKKQKGAVIIEKKMVPVSELSDMAWLCAWDGCEATFKGNMPKGWTFLYSYWALQPELHFMDIAPQDVFRDAALCPEHTKALERQLRKIRFEVADQKPAGSA